MTHKELFTDFSDVAEFAEANAEAGHHYFSPDTLRFFNQSQDDFKMMDIVYPGIALQFAYAPSSDEAMALPSHFVEKFLPEGMERVHGSKTPTKDTQRYMLKVSSILLRPDGTTGGTTADFTFFGTAEECSNNQEWEKETRTQLEAFANQIHDIWLCTNNNRDSLQLIKEGAYLDAVKSVIKSHDLDYDYKVWAAVRDVLEHQHGGQNA